MRFASAGGISSSFLACTAFAVAASTDVRAGDSEIDWNEAREFWAFKAPAEHPVPMVERGDWPRGDIDRFVLAKIEQADLQPAPAADRQTLARRVSFDLTGLAPGAKDVDAFIADTRIDAFGRFVDRLLDSPGFGERMASIWLSIARYAEDQAHQVGDNKKFFYPHAHRYRAWVIDAINRDLPYDQFVRYQLAADLLGGDGGANLEALGFLGLGPQYYNRNRLEVMAEEWEDSVDVVSRGFLGLTVACARCHQHKYDPVSMHDYQALAGVFASTAIDKREIADADGSKKTVHVVKEGKVQDLPIYVRGNVEDKGETVPRRFLEIISAGGAQPFTKGSGRLELAEAIADPANPLTARVAVNRLWQIAFGRGLVATPSNFGQFGARPTHPELLDHLALRFVRDGWSVKKLLRAMVLSSTYRQSSVALTETRKMDEPNQLFARAERKRLTAEMVRDALLSASGELQRGDSGGESKTVADPANLRRAVYGRVSRKELDAFMAAFDYPDANVHSSKRAATVTPAQKLFMLNSPFVIARAETLAATVLGSEPEAGIDTLYRVVLSRGVRDDERRQALAYLTADGAPYHERWKQFAHTLLMTNEFLFCD